MEDNPDASLHEVCDTCGNWFYFEDMDEDLLNCRDCDAELTQRERRSDYRHSVL